MGDDVHVQVGSAVAGDGRADAGTEDVLPGAAAGGAEDDLGGVGAAREVEQGGGYVVADDVVEAAAEVFDEGALGGQFPGEAEVRPSLRDMYTASSCPPAPFSASRAARRMRVRPSGPPVSPTTIRSREPQIALTACSLR